MFGLKPVQGGILNAKCSYYLPDLQPHLKTGYAFISPQIDEDLVEVVLDAPLHVLVVEHFEEVDHFGLCHFGRVEVVEEHG